MFHFRGSTSICSFSGSDPFSFVTDSESCLALIYNPDSSPFPTNSSEYSAELVSFLVRLSSFLLYVFVLSTFYHMIPTRRL
ncbi:MAG: hypothetical protein F6K22_18350 [Okeania sp. SIO2F4]|nr:hypothetical protein [Okeania sp. SIO2F4]